VVGGPRGALGYTVAVAGTALVTAPLLAFRGDVSKTTVVLAYLLVVTGAAAAGGLGPGITAAGLGFLAFDLWTSLVAHGSLEGTLRGVVGTVRSLLDLAGCAIVLTSGDSLHLAAVDGQVPGRPGRARPDAQRRARGRSVVVVAGGPGSSEFGEAERRVLATFANQAALAVERGQQEEQRNRALALQERDRLRTALLNSVSHDLRTPLASIKASASSLVDPLADVVGPVVRRARAASRQRVDVDVPDELAPVLVDPVRLDQVLTYLLDNARGYAPGSPVQVVAGQAGDSVELRVVDHGPGIPVPERERVFDQFYRLKGGKRPEGTGMGLAICRGIVQAHGGSLRVETTSGGGATFALTLPLLPSREVVRP
jgi:K+-sensing histidine kinase KdpD